MKRHLLIAFTLFGSPLFADNVKGPITSPAPLDATTSNNTSSGTTTTTTTPATVVNNTINCNGKPSPTPAPAPAPQPKPKPKPIPKPIPPTKKCPTCPSCPPATTKTVIKKEKEIEYINRQVTVYQPHSLTLLLGKGPNAFYPVIEKNKDGDEYKAYRDRGYLGGLMYEYQFDPNWAAGLGYITNDTWFVSGSLKWGTAYK